MMVRPGWFWVRSWTDRHSLKRKLAGRSVPRAARGVPAPKERGVKQTAKKLISLMPFEFNAFISVRSDLVRNPG